LLSSILAVVNAADRFLIFIFHLYVNGYNAAKWYH